MCVVGGKMGGGREMRGERGLEETENLHTRPRVMLMKCCELDVRQGMKFCKVL